MGDQLFGEMIRPVIIRAIAHDRGQPVGLAPCAYQMIRRGFARRVRRVWRVRSRLGKKPFVSQRSEYLVSRDVEQAEGRASGCIERAPVTQRLLQQRKRPD